MGLEVFRHRAEAGLRLAESLAQRVEGAAVVLGIPRGGVVVAEPVAVALRAPLDVIVPRKIGAPGERELALGALALVDGGEILLFDDSSLARMGLRRTDLAGEVDRQRIEIARRTSAYRRGRPAPALAGRTVVLVDDGIATGLTARAAGRAVLTLRPARVIVAAPVAPEGAREEFEAEGLKLVVLRTPAGFMAVGQFYSDFRAVEDQEVLEALERAERRDLESGGPGD